MSSAPSLISLGLNCNRNPFRGSLAEELELDPCQLTVVGSQYRMVVNDIVQKVVSGPSWFFVIEGDWGVGKTTVTRRVVCEVSKELGNSFVNIIIPVNNLLEPDLALLVLETVRRLYCATGSAMHDVREDSLAKAYQVLWGYIKGLKSMGDFCSRRTQEIPAPDWLGDCEQVLKFVGEASDFIAFVASEIGKPIYIVYDQFDLIFTRGDAKTRCMDAAIFLIHFVKDLLQKVSSSATRSRSRVVMVASIQSDAWAPFIESAKNIDLAKALGNYTLYRLQGLSLDEVRELIETYIASSGCRVRGNGVYPFDEDAIPIIYELSKGIPRKVINCAGRILQEAAYQGLTPPLRSSDVERIILSIFVNEYVRVCSDPDQVLKKYGLLEDPRKVVDYFIKVDNTVNTGQNYKPMNLNRPDAVGLICRDNTIIVITGAKIRVRKDKIRKIADEIPKRAIKQAHIIVFTLGRASEQAERLFRDLRNEGIYVHVKNLKDDPIAKIVAACLAYYAHNPYYAKEKLTEDKLVRMLRIVFERPNAEEC